MSVVLNLGGTFQLLFMKRSTLELQVSTGLKDPLKALRTEEQEEKVKESFSLF